MRHKTLPADQLQSLDESIPESHRDFFFVKARFLYGVKNLEIITLSGKTIMVPFDFFTDTEGKYHERVVADPNANPDFGTLEILDAGRTLALGRYVAPSEAIVLAFLNKEEPPWPKEVDTEPEQVYEGQDFGPNSAATITDATASETGQE